MTITITTVATPWWHEEYKFSKSLSPFVKQVYWKTYHVNSQYRLLKYLKITNWKLFQKCSLKQAAILQLSKAIALIKTVLVLQRKLSIHAVQCSVIFQNIVNWLIKIQWIALQQGVHHNPSSEIKVMFNYCNLQLVWLVIWKHFFLKIFKQPLNIWKTWNIES